ncbi:MAG TPA: PEGA domain-containing protein, partial [Vicinamibacterales bacterium]|nr:PEGA domain-containing protein [Vicinamibacterales bacterium]
MGPVFRAYDPQNDRPVAVKLFTVDLAPEVVHQFVADLDRLVAAELTHPAIARPLATGILGNSPYLVEEFVEAESLDIALRVHGRAPVPDALRIATQIAGALDFAAVSHMHHGALHPRDVLLSTSDVRITGIGIARMLEQVGITAPTRRPYAAPERVAGSVWHRFADIFSLAAVVYEMLWGRRLNGAGVQAVATLEPLPGGDLTALSLAFSRALAEDPGGRYSRALKFVEALKNAFPSDADTDTIRESHAFPPAEEFEAPTPSADAPVVFVAPPQLVYDPEPDAPPAEMEPFVQIAARAAEPRTPEFVKPPGTATFVLPAPVVDAEPDIDLQPAAEPRVETIVSAPRVIEPAPETVAPQPRATTLPFEVGPRRRDRARYMDSPEERDIDEADISGEDVASDLARVSLFERSRSAIWPIALALLLGVALAGGIGFLGGYWKGFTDNQPAPAAAVDAAAPPPPAREYTDSAVPEAAQPRATAAASTSAPAASAASAAQAAPQPATLRKTIPTAAQVGRILVRSTPAGARVAVDGHEYGVTPVIVRDLAVGTHTVHVARDGFVAEERHVRITRSRPSQPMEVTLARPRATAAATFTGGLSVDSRPSGARVFLDGRLVGTTPLQSHVVSAGEHAIRIEHDGYRQWTSAVRIISNEQN